MVIKLKNIHGGETRVPIRLLKSVTINKNNLLDLRCDGNKTKTKVRDRGVGEYARIWMSEIAKSIQASKQLQATLKS